jgi:F0F1-type ATP synthase assembly protein I
MTTQFLRLAPGAQMRRIAVMKFLLAILAYLLIGAVLSWGILLAVAGKPWLLVVAILVYLVAFAKIGCLSH